MATQGPAPRRFTQADQRRVRRSATQRSPRQNHSRVNDLAPTPRQLGELARLALTNAADLAADAQVLLDAERYPRAFALATLAAEEIGKHYLCVSWSGFDPAYRKVWRRFWKEFHGHTAKLEHWIGYVIDLVGNLDYETWDETWRMLPEGARSQHDVKLAAFYVDFRDGVPTLPRDMVSADTARKFLAAVQGTVRSLEAHWGASDIGQFLEDMAPKMRVLMTALKRARETGDWSSARAVFAETLGVPEEAIDVMLSPSGRPR